MNKNKKITSIGGMIIIVVLVGLLVYYVWPNVRNTVSSNLSREKKNCDYKNVDKRAGYSFQYPCNWIFTEYVFPNEGNIIDIKNTQDAVDGREGFGLNKGGTDIHIEVTGTNYPDYVSMLKDPKDALPQRETDRRMANIETVTIDGKKVQAFTGVKGPNVIPGENYDFIYDRKLYKFSIESSDHAQLNKDIGVFNDLVSSFRFGTK